MTIQATERHDSAPIVANQHAAELAFAKERDKIEHLGRRTYGGRTILKRNTLRAWR